jgi:hypothetical protein
MISQCRVPAQHASAVQTYMRGIVAGTNVSGSGASKTYTGGGHVIGPTLGPDTFIRNVSGPHFTFDFGSSFHIYSISFDWEIFPDGTCFRGPGDSAATRACAAGVGSGAVVAPARRTWPCTGRSRRLAYAAHRQKLNAGQLIAMAAPSGAAFLRPASLEKGCRILLHVL